MLHSSSGGGGGGASQLQRKGGGGGGGGGVRARAPATSCARDDWLDCTAGAERSEVPPGVADGAAAAPELPPASAPAAHAATMRWLGAQACTRSQSCTWQECQAIGQCLPIITPLRNWAMLGWAPALRRARLRAGRPMGGSSWAPRGTRAAAAAA